MLASPHINQQPAKVQIENKALLEFGFAHLIELF